MIFQSLNVDQRRGHHPITVFHQPFYQAFYEGEGWERSMARGERYLQDNLSVSVWGPRRTRLFQVALCSKRGVPCCFFGSPTKN